MAQGNALYATGNRLRGTQVLEEARRDSVAARSPEIIGTIHGVMCHFLLLLEGASPSVVDATRTAIDASESAGTPYSIVLGSTALAETELIDGDVESAAKRLEQSLRIIEERRSGGVIRGVALAGCARALLAQGRIDAARDRASEAVEFARSHHLGWNLGPWLTWVSALVASGDERGARDALGEAQQWIDETGAVIYQPHWHECCAAFHERFGDAAAQREELRKAHELFAQLGATDFAARLENTLASLG
jgi:ATP/maltotriose-dependent transcriptional regulator MalT